MILGPRPIMPTNHVCQKFEFLQNSILNMFELKKIVDKTEAEHKVKIQKGRDGTPTGRVNFFFFAFTVYFKNAYWNTFLFNRNDLLVMPVQLMEIERNEGSKRERDYFIFLYHPKQISYFIKKKIYNFFFTFSSSLIFFSLFFLFFFYYYLYVCPWKNYLFQRL